MNKEPNPNYRPAVLHQMIVAAMWGINAAQIPSPNPYEGSERWASSALAPFESRIWEAAREAYLQSEKEFLKQ